jgi:putative ABC transport system permease protein
VIGGLPYSFYDDSTVVSIEGQAPLPMSRLPQAMVEPASNGYFRTMSLALLSGRNFSVSDSSEASPVAVVSQAMASRFWPGTRAVGKRLKLGALDSEAPWLTVVGIVADTRHEVYDRSFRSVIYRPLEQMSPRSMDFVIRVVGDPMRLAPAVRAEVARVDKEQPIERLESMTIKIRNQARALQYVARLMGIFGLIAMILAVVGVYGVMSQYVSQLHNEIGIRIALGAQTRHVLCNIMGRGFAITARGLVIGVVSGFSLSQLLSSFLYGVTPWNPVIFTAVPCSLALIALLACYIPAWRATRIDPLVTLKYE